ncbi:MAG TPA: SDR family NAD(P)-dependent oxidoreductase [Candidatus Kapabacteria bacterium]|nr:SDR family NAD(P)-dependent oxidoreductase [Candidatus Kapabacteria bacterium]
MNALQNRVALVTGASRGAGRGIALALADRGATVYVTGRSARGGATTENLAGTVEETARLITERGGTGIAVRCDHTDDADVERLFQRIGAEHGRLDLLVNNVWGGYEGHEGAGFVAPFWEQPMRHWDGMFVAGLRAHIVAGRLAVPLMLPQRSGLIVNTVAWDRGLYLGNLFYDVAKAAIVRLAFAMAQELKPHGVVAVALAPGFMRTERVMQAHAEHPLDLLRTESPEYAGRVIAAMAADPDVARLSGGVHHAGDLAPHYGVTDIDGRLVPPFRIDE